MRKWKFLRIFFLAVLVFLNPMEGQCEEYGDSICNNTFSKHPKLESILIELQCIYKKNMENARNFADERNIKLKDQNKVIVVLIFEQGKTTNEIDIASLQALGADIIKSDKNVLKAEIPINMLLQIADNVIGLSFIKLPDEFIPLDIQNIQSEGQNIQSEGVSLTGASLYHSAGYKGKGVKVAIIDSGFADLSSAVSNGELPSSVKKIDCTGKSCVETTFDSETNNHGTFVAGIVYDMAPESELYLIKIKDSLDLKDAKE
ncbi:MAG: S8 family serine peptidase [Nitrospirae bacterium]|nr:S8 family serine peptidase [Nitrospirota bacterium]